MRVLQEQSRPVSWSYSVIRGRRDRPGEGGSSAELARSKEHQGGPTVLGVRRILPTLRQELLADHPAHQQPSHRTPDQPEDQEEPELCPMGVEC